MRSLWIELRSVVVDAAVVLSRWFSRRAPEFIHIWAGRLSVMDISGTTIIADGPRSCLQIVVLK